MWIDSPTRCLPLLIIVLAMIISTPLMEKGWGIRLFLGLLWSTLFGLTGSFVIPTRGWLRIFAVLALLAIVSQAVNSALGEPVWTRAVQTLTILGIEVAAFYGVLRHALLAEAVRHEIDRTLAAISGYFLLALVWSKFFEFAILADPGAIQHGDRFVDYAAKSTVVYYSLVTLTTVGYGDITPVNPYVRLLAGAEGAIGTLYVAVVIASLIGRLMMARAERSGP